MALYKFRIIIIIIINSAFATTFIILYILFIVYTIYNI